MIDNTILASVTEYNNSLRQTTPYFQNFYYEMVEVVKHTRPEVKNWLDTGCGTGNMVLEAQQSINRVSIGSDSIDFPFANLAMMKVCHN